MIVLRRGALLGLLLLSFGASVLLANDAEIAQLKAQMSGRYTQLRAAISAGKIGETSEGFVAAVTADARAQYAGLIAEENADRSKLYALLADKLGTSVDQVAARAAMHNLENAQPGDYLRKPDGTWVRKR